MLTGIYALGFETSQFVPSGSDCRWWLSGNAKPIWVATRSPQGMESASVRVKVEGIVRQPDCNGHMGVYRREWNVARILSLAITAPHSRSEGRKSTLSRSEEIGYPMPEAGGHCGEHFDTEKRRGGRKSVLSASKRTQCQDVNLVRPGSS